MHEYNEKTLRILLYERMHVFEWAKFS